MLRRAFLILLVIFVAWGASAGTISRPTGNGKTAGASWASGDTLNSAAINADFDTVYTLVNGNLNAANLAANSVAGSELTDSTVTNAKVDAAAAIVYTKFAQTAAAQDADIVDDFSTDDAEHLSATAPGTSEAIGTKPTNLEEEIGDIRYTIGRLAMGTSASEINTGSATSASVNWIDGPVRPRNMVYNGGFDFLNTLATGADGDGWTRVLTPTTIASEDLADTHGDGVAINIIDTGAALGGIKQTIDGLKASTRYLALVDVKDDVGTCRILTAGADTNQLSVDSDDTGNWQTIGGIFTTDSTPTDVVLSLLAVAQSDDCIFENVGVWELNTDPGRRAPQVSQQACTTEAGNIPTAFATSPNPAATVAVTVPGPGYMILVDAYFSVDDDNGSGHTMEAQIAENGTQRAHTGSPLNAQNAIFGGAMTYVLSEPTPGTTYSYDIDLLASNATGADYRSGEVCIRVTLLSSGA